MEPLAGELARLVPGSPEDLGLPYPHWRTHQREAVQDVLRAYAEGYKCVLLSAPTGSGKTIIGAAVGRMLEGHSLFLSHTIHLQNQQLRTLPEARTATGRGNWVCSLKTAMGEEMKASEAPCPPCPDKDGELDCGYYGQMIEAGESPEAVLNYAYALRILQARRLKGFENNPFSRRGLMVCDEGHLLERALVEAVAAPLNYKTFEVVGLDPPRRADLEEWTEWARSNIGEAEHETASAHRKYVRMRTEGAGAHAQKQVLTDYRRWHAIQEALKSLLELANVPAHLQPTQTGYRARPLWVWDLLPGRLFRHADRVLIMSATLGDPEITARLLGLNEWEYTHIEVPSAFPVENRLVFYWPVAKMRHGMPDQEKVRQAQALDELARKFPTTPGVVHCNSFALGEFLTDAVQPETRWRMWPHTRAYNPTPAFESEGLGGKLDNAILVTPSATTGVDWDFVGWAMLPKVPFPDLGDDIVRLRTDYVTKEGEPIGQKVYRQEAAMAMVQASGRHVRTETSKGVTIITDSAFYPLFKHLAPGAFPEWFRDAFRWRE